MRKQVTLHLESICCGHKKSPKITLRAFILNWQRPTLPP